jgi:hypothetical protein
MSESHARPSRAVEVAIGAMHADGDLSPLTVARLETLMRQFARFVERGHHAAALDLVTPEMVRGFVEAPTADGLAPGPSLQQFRRLAVRVVYRATRRLGIADGDRPSILCCLRVPPEPSGRSRTTKSSWGAPPSCVLAGPEPLRRGRCARPPRGLASWQPSEGPTWTSMPAPFGSTARPGQRPGSARSLRGV